ncbi:helix-turn-helix domain-containing protein [Serratia sp. T13T92]|uniref:helix-turn-helix domain-containing protein n=1 Tax=Serratia sp. T13T92 TaxID=3397496 RepID=UPI0039E0B46F
MLSKKLPIVFQKDLGGEQYFNTDKIPTHYVQGGKNKVILLLSGSVFLKRITDDMIVSKIKAPFVFGVHESISNKGRLYIKPLSSSLLKLVDFDVFYKNVSPEIITEICAKLIEIYQIRDEGVISTSVYDCIKKCLEDISLLDDAEKKNTSIFGYVTERNKVSRSSVYNILRELEKGGYIKTKRGKLLEMNKVPKSF